MNQLICEKRTYERDYHFHKHSYAQFLFPLLGSMEIKTDNKEIHLKPDHCLFLPEGCNHTFRSNERNEFLVLDIPDAFSQTINGEEYLEMDEAWSSIRFLLLEECQSSKKNTSSALSHLARFAAQKIGKRKPLSIQYIHENFRERISIEKLAAIEHYHPAYFTAWFKKQTGKTPKDYISTIRLNEAKRLLRESSFSMTRISEEIGFEKPSSFSRWFVRTEGITPQDYRKY
ncbi:AraC family transcriptional regulator [Metabacillus sp. RGM 3146]|uniref:helix-turn-helix transcriptional regulator n=1 Tax=Metabacillus sp. RGM 3146 TaxID=3401092 RepID=UPI003B9975AE